MSYKKGGNKFFDIFKVGAVTSAGAIFGMIPQLLIGTIILLLGIYLVNTEKKSDSNSNKNNEYQHGLNFYLGIGLIIIGSVISLNLFFGIEFITSLFDNN